jgi:hypothetical protein
MPAFPPEARRDLDASPAPQIPEKAGRLTVIANRIRNSQHSAKVAAVVKASETPRATVSSSIRAAQEERKATRVKVSHWTPNPKLAEKEVAPAASPEPAVSTKAETKPEPKAETKAETKPEPRAETQAETKTETKTETKAESAPAAKADSGEKPSAETKTDAVAAPDASTLPAEYVRSLKSFGVSDADIATGMAANPEIFRGMAAMMHKARTKEISEFAALGRAKQSAPQQAERQAPAPVVAPLQAVRLIDADSLKAKYGPGSTALIDELVRPVNAAIQQMAHFQRVQDQAQIEATNHLVDGFFAGPELLPYAAEYKDPKARDAVVELATHIINGATAAHKKMGLTEALLMAHDATAVPKLRETARAAVINEVKKRNAALTLRPSGSAAPAPTGQTGGRAKNMDALRETVHAKLAALKR